MSTVGMSTSSVLPVELWLEVYHHTTFVPDILEPDIYRHMRSIVYLNYEHHRMIQHALVTKRSLVLVCKAWLRQCLPLLYRSIFIRKAGSLSALTSTLKASYQQSLSQPDDEMRSLGHHTTKFDFALIDWFPKARPDDTRLLEQVIRCLPNLSVISFSICSCSPTVTYPGQGFYPEKEDLERLLASASNLRILGSCDVAVNHRIPNGTASHPPSGLERDVPTLRELTISMGDWEESPVDPVNMPSVKYLGLRCDRKGLSSRHYQVLANFLGALDDEESMRTKSLRVVQFLDPVNVANLIQGMRGESRAVMLETGPRCKFSMVGHAWRPLRSTLEYFQIHEHKLYAKSTCLLEQLSISGKFNF
ncbi:hypothetical protein F5I97DRAFT_1923746 [Phlebopus sp. FC_14]|nr:hypothetical protein F5I97DRAFT_1923746 [Phlebopus sp. FC_14]